MTSPGDTTPRDVQSDSVPWINFCESLNAPYPPSQQGLQINAKPRITWDVGTDLVSHPLGGKCHDQAVRSASWVHRNQAAAAKRQYPRNAMGKGLELRRTFRE